MSEPPRPVPRADPPLAPHDEATSSTSLARASGRVRKVLELALEDTGALLAVRRAPSVRPPLAPLPPDDPDPGHTEAALRITRRLVVLVGLNASLYLGIAGVCVARAARDPGAIPEVVLAVLSVGLGVWGLNAARHLFRSTRVGPRDPSGARSGHALADALHALRTIFVLKGTGLFLALALACFAFSAVISVLALL